VEPFHQKIQKEKETFFFSPSLKNKQLLCFFSSQINHQLILLFSLRKLPKKEKNKYLALASSKRNLISTIIKFKISSLWKTLSKRETP
jgi:hypothetical protein